MEALIVVVSEVLRSLAANRVRTGVLWFVVGVSAFGVSRVQLQEITAVRAEAAGLQRDGAGLVLVRLSRPLAGAECDRIAAGASSLRSGGVQLGGRRVRLSVDPLTSYRLIGLTSGAAELVELEPQRNWDGLVVGGLIAKQLGIQSGDLVAVDGSPPRPVLVLASAGSRTSEYDRAVVEVIPASNEVDLCLVEFPMPVGPASLDSAAGMVGDPTSASQFASRSQEEWKQLVTRFATRPTRHLPAIAGAATAFIFGLTILFRSREWALYRTLGLSQLDLGVFRSAELAVLLSSVPLGWGVAVLTGPSTDEAALSLSARGSLATAAIAVTLTLIVGWAVDLRHVANLAKSGF